MKLLSIEQSKLDSKKVAVFLDDNNGIFRRECEHNEMYYLLPYISKPYLQVFHNVQGNSIIYGEVVLTIQNQAGARPKLPFAAFNINMKKLGDCSAASDFLNLWNADADNAATGKLVATNDPYVYRFQASGRYSKCPTKLFGSRYFQFDVVANNLVDVIGAPENSLISFGDGTPLMPISYDMSVFKYDSSGGVKPNAFTRFYRAAGVSWGAWIRGGYEFDNAIYFKASQLLLTVGYWYAASGNYTVTIYHSEGEYFFNNDSRYGAGTGTKYANLRGYMPDNTLLFSLSGTTNATFNTFANVNFGEWKTKLKYFNARSDGSYVVQNYSGINLVGCTNIEVIDMQWGSVNLLTNLTGGALDMGSLFPSLRVLGFSYSQYVAGVRLNNCTKLRDFYFTGSSQPATEIDNYWNDLDTALQGGTGGNIKIFNARTAASNAAYASLIAKGFTVYSY